jgi:large subunit ribosomal protein L21
VYAIVRNGGRQEKVAVGDVIEIDRHDVGQGDSLSLPAVLVVDGESVTTDADALSAVDVRAEVVGRSSGPKIKIFKYRNKTGYRKRQGHRQHYTTVKVTAIDTPGGSAAATESAASQPAATQATATQPAAETDTTSAN